MKNETTKLEVTLSRIFKADQYPVLVATPHDLKEHFEENESIRIVWSKAFPIEKLKNNKVSLAYAKIMLVCGTSGQTVTYTGQEILADDDIRFFSSISHVFNFLMSNDTLVYNCLHGKHTFLFIIPFADDNNRLCVAYVKAGESIQKELHFTTYDEFRDMEFEIFTLSDNTGSKTSETRYVLVLPD